MHYILTAKSWVESTRFFDWLGRERRTIFTVLLMTNSIFIGIILGRRGVLDGLFWLFFFYVPLEVGLFIGSTEPDP
jgi:hypothetical protein